jgi:hypothetical protein
LSYIDDLRSIGHTEEGAWLAGRQAASLCNYHGIQDAARKRRAPSQTPDAWAGSVLHTDKGEVNVLVSNDKWKKTKSIIERLVDEERLNREGAGTGLNGKQLLRDRGFLIYISRAYPAMVPYLKGICLTIDHWRPGRDADGWKRTMAQMEAHLEHKRRDAGEEEVVHEPPKEAPALALPVYRLRADLACLAELTAFDVPPRRKIRSSEVIRVEYGLGDASGKGFGSSIFWGSKVIWRSGQWKKSFESESSNWREFENIVKALEEYYNDHADASLKIFMFFHRQLDHGEYRVQGDFKLKEAVRPRPATAEVADGLWMGSPRVVPCVRHSDDCFRSGWAI